MKCLNSALILTSFLLCTSCGNTSINSRDHGDLKDHLSDHELDEIRLYAERFQFKQDSDSLIVYPEEPGPLAREAIERASKINEKRHLPYLALYVLRRYRENVMRDPKNYHSTKLARSGVLRSAGGVDLEYEFVRLTILPTSRTNFFDINSCYDWIKKHDSKFSNYPPIKEELIEVEQLRKNLDRQRQEMIAEFGLDKLERFAIETPFIPHRFAPAPVPEEINRVLEKLREENRTEHLPYVLEYGLNLYLKHLTCSQLARVLPIDENPMLSELIRLTKIPKYKTAHEAGWLNRQVHDSIEDINGATGYSSYQIYIWYLENWYSVTDMPNVERLCDIQKRIEKTGMQGVGGGGQVCHYGCYSLVSED